MCLRTFFNRRDFPNPVKGVKLWSGRWDSNPQCLAATAWKAVEIAITRHPLEFLSDLPRSSPLHELASSSLVPRIRIVVNHADRKRWMIFLLALLNHLNWLRRAKSNRRRIAYETILDTNPPRNKLLAVRVGVEPT